jgi:hypothetical protein
MFGGTRGIGNLGAGKGVKLSPIRKTTPRFVSLELARELQFLFMRKTKFETLDCEES